MVGLYPGITHNEGLKMLRNQYDKFIDKTVPKEDIIKMADFVLKNNLFEFNSKSYRLINDVFFILTDTEENLDNFLEDLDKFHLNLTFTDEKSREKKSISCI